MSIDEIKELIRVLQETGIAELEVQRGDNRVRIRLNGGSSHEVVIPAVVPTIVSPIAPVTATSPQTQASGVAGTPGAAAEDESTLFVKSPMVGTYYDAPSPDVAPYVKVGDRVHAKQVLCIIESMKLMNEIEADVSGTIVAKLVDNGRPVEYGESLFAIRPV